MAEAAGDTDEAICRYELASQTGTKWPLINLARLHERMNQSDEIGKRRQGLAGSA
jgi:hypothetical protein